MVHSALSDADGAAGAAGVVVDSDAARGARRAAGLGDVWVGEEGDPALAEFRSELARRATRASPGTTADPGTVER